MLARRPVKQIAAIHDLSGFGRTSLSVVIPILSAMGTKVCPLPTAVLSLHSRYEGYHFTDLTAHCITPNLTEAALLLNEPYHFDITDEEIEHETDIEDWHRDISRMMEEFRKTRM